MTIFQFAWPQLDISPCSYQSNSVIALILLCLATLFSYSSKLFLFCIISYRNFQKHLVNVVVNIRVGMAWYLYGIYLIRQNNFSYILFESIMLCDSGIHCVL